MSYDNGYEREGQLQFVSDAVLAFAYALRDMQRDLCEDDYHGVCPRMRDSDGSELLNYLRQVQFIGIKNNNKLNKSFLSINKSSIKILFQTAH
jgi:metabotropic X receptor